MHMIKEDGRGVEDEKAAQVFKVPARRDPTK